MKKLIFKPHLVNKARTAYSKIKSYLPNNIQLREKPAIAGNVPGLYIAAADLTGGPNQAEGVARLTHIKKAKDPLYKAFTLRMEAIRFIAIASIVWGHTLFGWENQVFTSPVNKFIQLLFMQLGRFGTVNFFIISGFFFAGKVNTMGVRQYIKYRMRSLVIPWLIFVCLFVTIQLLQLYALPQILHMSGKQLIPAIFNLFEAAIFHAAFWFIPLSLISAIFLIIFRKYILKRWFGVLLLAISVFYSINLYFAWLPVNHAKSFLGYVFFMWLGVLARNNMQRVKFMIENIRWRYLLPAIAAAFILSCNEGRNLQLIHCADAFGSTRLSNEMLSLLIFAALLKWRTIYRIKKLQPKKYVYGVYLVHTVIVLEVLPLAAKFIAQHNLFANIPVMIALQIAAFSIIIVLSYLLSVLIKNSKLRFLTGR